MPRAGGGDVEPVLEEETLEWRGDAEVAPLLRRPHPGVAIVEEAHELEQLHDHLVVGEGGHGRRDGVHPPGECLGGDGSRYGA